MAQDGAGRSATIFLRGGGSLCFLSKEKICENISVASVSGDNRGYK